MHTPRPTKAEILSELLATAQAVYNGNVEQDGTVHEPLALHSIRCHEEAARLIAAMPDALLP
jgi:hypothetical protein